MFVSGGTAGLNVDLGLACFELLTIKGLSFFCVDVVLIEPAVLASCPTSDLHVCLEMDVL